MRSTSSIAAAFASTDGFCRLPARFLYRLQGPDTVRLLQGLVTNNMATLEHGGDAFFCAFLSANGRVLFDAFVYPENTASTFSQTRDAFIIETDQRCKDVLKRHIDKYILRYKVKCEAADDLAVWQCFGPSAKTLWAKRASLNNASLHNASLNAPPQIDSFSLSRIGCRDPRHEHLGARFLLPADTQPALPHSFVQVNSSEYHLFRMIQGIPEGASDFLYEVALPLESNLDFMAGSTTLKSNYS